MRRMIFPNPHSADSDSDGLEDGEDPLPCFPSQPDIWYSRPPEFKPLFEFHDPRVNAAIYSAWNEDSLCIKIEIDRLLPVKILLDGHGDGWFEGRENLLIKMTPLSDSTLTSSVEILNSSDPHQWPFMDKTLSKSVNINPVIRKSGHTWTINLNVPRSDLLNLSFKRSKKLGLLIGFLVEFDKEGSKRYIDPFEPNRFLYLNLMGSK